MESVARKNLEMYCGERLNLGQSPQTLASRTLAGAGEAPSPPAAGSSGGQQEDSQWLATLSEPELDLLISLKMLAVTRANNAGHPHLARLFDLRTLRALRTTMLLLLLPSPPWHLMMGIVLLESFKEGLKETSVDPSIIDRLALLSDPGADFTNRGCDSEVVKPNKDQLRPNSVMKKRKQMQDGCHEEVPHQSTKRRKMSERR